MTDSIPVEIFSWVEDAKKTLLDAGVFLDLQDVSLLEYSPGQFCSGYFGDENEEGMVVFACAMKRPWEDWFPVFVHEFCHFEQWRDRRDWWNSLKFDESEGVDLAIEAWEGKREATQTQIIHWCLTSAIAEIDCEKRALAKIVEHNLPLDVKDYAKKANSYITYYYAMPELKGWCNGDRPYEVQAIMDLMPDHMDLTDLDYWALANKAMDLYRNNCLYERKE